mmetsp:Transcript_61614/g.102252  ORF Transcript_61614/g.102252 Transcript_61614/m.102252 type:complete len:127 (+) Transcript_61614:623-1003(+)
MARVGVGGGSHKGGALAGLVIMDKQAMCAADGQFLAYLSSQPAAPPAVPHAQGHARRHAMHSRCWAASAAAAAVETATSLIAMTWSQASGSKTGVLTCDGSSDPLCQDWRIRRASQFVYLRFASLR